MGLFNKPSGSGLINQAISGFKKSIEQLEEGIELNRAEVDKNIESIAELQNTNIGLKHDTTKARTIVDNLRELLGEV